MAYTLYENLGGPNDVLAKMRDFFVLKNWTVLANCITDYCIDGQGSSDGKLLAVKKNDVYAVLRSANGKMIFEAQANSNNAHGIGLMCATNFTPNPPSGYWYDQPNAPRDVNTQKQIGVGIPVKPSGNVRLYCNAIEEPKPMVVFSLEVVAGVFCHMAVGEVEKVGKWSGGTVFSASRSSYNMFPSDWTADILTNGSNHLFGFSSDPSTFLRIDIDAAPLRDQPVLWAAAGPATGTGATGKILASMVVNTDTMNAGYFPKVPHYGYLQSQSASDYGRNVNTLNCISVNLPIMFFVQRDPDSLMNFSQVGSVPGVYQISMRNVAPGSCYEKSYPRSGYLHQALPHVQRAGRFGYDGISIKQ